MHLLTFAHYGEASFFIQKLGLKPINKNLFTGLFRNDDSVMVLITGEGVEKSLLEVTKALTYFGDEISHVINLGVCGTFKKEIKLGDAFEIRTIYKNSDSGMNFYSFSGEKVTKLPVLDCVTIGERLKNIEMAQKISCFAPLVDREFWGVSYSSKSLNVPFSSIKIVSDYAFDFDICVDVASKANEYSEKLLNYYVNEIKDNLILAEEKSLLPEGFYGTVTQRRIVEKLFSNYSIKFKREIPLDLFEEVKKLAKNPKKRTEILINKINSLLFPFENKFNDLLRSFKGYGLDISFEEDFETSTIELKKKIYNKNDFDNFKKNVSSFPYEKLVSLLEGELDEI